MSTATAISPVQIRTVSRPKTVEKKMTLAEFREEFGDKEDGFKYEFSDGKVIKTQSTMNPKQLFIVQNILRRFAQTFAYANRDELFLEVNQSTGTEKLRRPDLSYWPAGKIKSGQEKVSPFVIEIISPTDKSDEIETKLFEYFSAGVKVVWHIRPNFKTVHVFTSPTKIKICMGDEICSAAPVVPDFEMTADEVFFK